MNSLYTQGYGWAPLKEIAVRINSEDARLRLDAGAKENTASTPGLNLVLGLVAIAALAVIWRRKG
ncbi:MAG: hypothetical protein KAT65_29925 [Methanophagales archaeon]|nr:hypothetical protein [Methanophagales archaeon]